MYQLVVISALLAVACAHVVAPTSYAAAPIINTYAAAPALVHTAPVVKTYSQPAVAISHAISKQVHYASQPVVTGYSSQILKPNLGALATPLAGVTQQRVLAPARTVATITPQITQVEPELHVRKVPVDVPVAQPYISQVEVHHPAPIVSAPAISYAAHVAPIGYAAHAAPAIGYAAHAVPQTYAAVPAIGHATLKTVSY